MKELSEEMMRWIDLHRGDDTMKLRLRYHGDKEKTDAIMQIECRRKAASKLAETLARSDRFLFPTTLSAEQSTSDRIARFHSTLLGNPGKLLDMTCGLAIDAFHAADAGMEVTAIDINPEVAETAAVNARALGLKNFTAIAADSAEWLAAQSDDTQFSCIFIDPARRGAHGEKLVTLSLCSPDVEALLPLMLRHSQRIVIKASPMLDVSLTLKRLASIATPLGAGVSSIMAIGNTRECKELVIIVEQGCGTETKEMAVTFLADGKENRWEISPAETPQQLKKSAMPEEGMFLYEPYPAVMKLGKWDNLLAQWPEAAQLNPNTHLYVSASPLKDFPGEEFRIIEATAPGSRALKEIAAKYKGANVTTRNFTMTAPQLMSKLKMKQSDQTRIFGVRAGDGRGVPLLLVTTPVNDAD